MRGPALQVSVPQAGRGHLIQEVLGRHFLPTQSRGGDRDWMEGQTCSQKASNPLSREAGRHSLSPSLYPPPDSLPRFLCGGAHVCFVNAGRRITKEGCAEGGVSGTTAGGCVEIPGGEKSLRTGSPSLTLGSAWLVGGLRAPIPVPGPSHIPLPLASSRPATCRA